MRKVKINIEGMTCASCAGHVEKSLLKIKGVKNISVNAVVDKAFLEAEKNITEDKLKKAVADAGYAPKEVEFEEVSSSSKKPSISSETQK